MAQHQRAQAKEIRASAPNPSLDTRGSIEGLIGTLLIFSAPQNPLRQNPFLRRFARIFRNFKSFDGNNLRRKFTYLRT